MHTNSLSSFTKHVCTLCRCPEEGSLAKTIHKGDYRNIEGRFGE